LTAGEGLILRIEVTVYQSARNLRTQRCGFGRGSAAFLDPRGQSIIWCIE
jgi:hypothetical protein